MPETVIATSIRGRPSVPSGTRVAPHRPAVAVEAGGGAHQPERLGDRAAFGLQVVGAPQHHRNGFRQALAVRLVPGEQAVGLAGAVLHREGAGQAERVEAVQVAPGGQHLGGAQQVAAGRRADVAAIERVDDGGHFGVGGQQQVQPGAFGRVGDAGGVEHLGALVGVGRLAQHVQAVRDEGVFQFEQRGGQAQDLAVGVRPGRLGRAQLHGEAACAWTSAAISPRSAPGSAERQRSRLAFRSSRPRYSPAWATGGVR